MKNLDIYDESTGKQVGTVPFYDGKEIAEMVDIAYEAQPKWEKVPLFQRAKLLWKFSELIDEHRNEIAMLMACEMGKPLKNALTECSYSAEIARNNIERGKHLYGHVLCDSSEGHENNVMFIRYEALGVVAAVIPFNYPTELTVQKIVPGLLMGNTFVVKASTKAPCSVKKVIDLAHEAGIPKEVLHYVTGTREDCTENLLTNPKVACLALTGGNKAGTETIKCSADTIKKVVLELGGNDPLIIPEEAADDPEVMVRAVQALGWGRIMENNGQVCASPKRTIVHKRAKDIFVKCLIEFVNGLKRGHASDPDAELTRLVSSEAAKRVEEQIKHTVDQGARVIYGGKRDGCFMEVTILDGVTKDMDIAKDMEVFGPVIPLIEFETDEEAVAIANQSKYGLSASVITKDLKKAFYFAENIESSAVVVNGSSALRHNDQPFGGCKQTGIGTEGALTSCEEFARMKSYHFCDVSPKEHLYSTPDGVGDYVNVDWLIDGVKKLANDLIK